MKNNVATFSLVLLGLSITLPAIAHLQQNSSRQSPASAPTILQPTQRLHLHAAGTPRPKLLAAAGGFLQNGKYTCIAGFRVMMTLGEMTISGNSYRFHPPQGPDTAGTFSQVAKGIQWHGDVGIIKNKDIVESDRDQGTRTDDFWLTFSNDLTRGGKANLNCKL